MVDVTIERLAGICGLSSTAVTTLARRGIMIRATGPGARGKFVLEPSIRSYCTHLREQASGRKEGDAPAADRSRLVKAQAQAIETKRPSGAIAEVRKRTLAALIPPAELPLSQWLEANVAGLANTRQRGALVDSEAVVREWEGICRTNRAGMLRIPKRAAARLSHLTPQDVRTFDDEVRAVLTELVLNI